MHSAVQMPTRTAAAATIGLRPAGPADAEFLFRVYASTREEELAQVDWTNDQREAFLRMQFAAQSRHYAGEYPGAEFQVILVEDQPAGRLYVHRRPREIRVMDIALLPQFRRRGVGTFLVTRLFEEGDATQRAVSIHVEAFNPARHWYQRLGFRPAGNTGVYQLMRREPSLGGASESQPRPQHSLNA